MKTRAKLPTYKTDK